MLVADPEVAFLDRRHLKNWWTLALPPGISADTRFALVVLEGGQPIHAIISGQGAIDLSAVDFVGTSPLQLAKLTHSLRVDGCLVLERDALARLIDSMQRGLRTEHSLPEQGIGMWQALRSAQGIWSHPPLLHLIPPLTSAPLQKTFDLLVPDDSAVLAYILEEKRVHASGIAVKRAGCIEGAFMQPLIADLVTERELARDWKQNYRRVNEAVASRLAKPAISVFADREAVYRVLQGPPEQLAKELKARNIIVDPAPLWLQGLLGGAAVAAAATQNAKRVARFLPKGARKMAGDLAGAAQDRIKNSTTTGPFASLGFDPIALIQTLRGFYSTR